MSQGCMALLCYMGFMIAPVLLGYGDKGEYDCLCDGLRCDPAALFELLKDTALLFHTRSWEISAEKQL